MIRSHFAMRPLALMAVVAMPTSIISTIAHARTDGPHEVAPTNEADLAASRGGILFLMPLTSLGSADETISIIEQVLQAQLDSLVGDRLETAAMLSQREPRAHERLERCEGATVCLAARGRELGWQFFVAGNVTGIGTQRVINLKLIDVATGEQMGMSSEEVSGDEAELVPRMRKAAVTLLEPHRSTAELVFVAEQPNLQIFVDGKLIGTTPLKQPKVPVAAGRHSVEARSSGFVPFRTITELGYDESKQISIHLGKSSLDIATEDLLFRDQWWTWAVIGAGAIAMGVGVHFNIQHSDAANEIEYLARAGRLDSTRAGLYDEQKTNWNRAVGSYATGGVLIGLGGLLLALDFM